MRDWELVEITVYFRSPLGNGLLFIFKINEVIEKGQAQIFCFCSWDLSGSNNISSQSV